MSDLQSRMQQGQEARRKHYEAERKRQEAVYAEFYERVGDDPANFIDWLEATYGTPFLTKLVNDYNDAIGGRFGPGGAA